MAMISLKKACVAKYSPWPPDRHAVAESYTYSINIAMIEAEGEVGIP